MTTETIESLKHYCNNCQGTTHHYILMKESNPSEDPEYHYETICYMLKCKGCENISFRVENHDYETSYPDEFDNWTHDITTKIYPFPLENHRPLEEQYILPPQIRIVYQETINALKSNCLLLSGVGFRAVIEAVCIDKQIVGRNLESKINNLSRNRFITENEAERLHAVRFMGNDSVHEMAVPKLEALYVVLEIIEHLLKSLYIIDHHAKPMLDTFISSYEDFESLLQKKLRKFKSGDEFPLAKYLERDVRRLNGQITTFETELISKISSNEYDKLKIGDIKPFGANTTNSFQHFIKS